MIQSKRFLLVLGAGLAVSAGNLWADNAAPAAQTTPAAQASAAPASKKWSNPTMQSIQDAIDLDNAGNTTAAVAAFEKIGPVKSKNLEAWRLNDEATVYIKIGDYAKAVDLLEKAVDSNDKNYVALNNLGTCYEETGELDKAKDAYQKSIDAAKDAGASSAKAEGNLAALQARMGATAGTKAESSDDSGAASTTGNAKQ